MGKASPRGGTRQEGIDDEDIRRDDRGDVLPLATVVIEEVDDLGFIVEELAQLSLQPRSDVEDGSATAILIGVTMGYISLGGVE